jgi:hypothetical protein
LKMKVEALSRKVDALTVGRSINSSNTFSIDSYSTCTSPMHLAQNCPSSSNFVECPMEQVNAFNNYRKQANESLSESYNPGWQNHPNFLWKKNQFMGQGGALITPKANTPLDFILVRLKQLWCTKHPRKC